MGQSLLKTGPESRPLAENQARPALTLVAGGRADASVAALSTTPLSTTALSWDIIGPGLALIALQLGDGILTAVGMSLYGTEMEGNTLLRGLMHFIGYLPALVLVKGASIALIILLCQQAKRARWLKPTFYMIIALYVLCAIVPWTYILLSDLAEAGPVFG